MASLNADWVSLATISSGASGDKPMSSTCAATCVPQQVIQQSGISVRGDSCRRSSQGWHRKIPATWLATWKAFRKSVSALIASDTNLAAAVTASTDNDQAETKGERMTLMVATLLCFVVLLCLGTFKTLLMSLPWLRWRSFLRSCLLACLQYWPRFSFSPSKGASSCRYNLQSIISKMLEMEAPELHFIPTAHQLASAHFE